MITSDRVPAVDVCAELHELEHHGSVPAARREVQGGAALRVLGRHAGAQLDQARRHADQARPVGLYAAQLQGLGAPQQRLKCALCARPVCACVPLRACACTCRDSDG